MSYTASQLAALEALAQRKIAHKTAHPVTYGNSWSWDRDVIIAIYYAQDELEGADEELDDLLEEYGDPDYFYAARAA